MEGHLTGKVKKMDINELTLGQIKEIQNMAYQIPEDHKAHLEYRQYIGERPTIYAMNYIYTGDCVAIVGDSIVFENAMIVYNTGDHKTVDWSDAEQMPGKWSVAMQSIESHGIFK